MPSAQEKAAFAQRLQTALRQFALKQGALNPKARPLKGGIDLAREFNLRYTGNVGVSPQSAYKWLNGSAIPKTDKLKTLAAWLEVSEHWLHYGLPPDSAFLKQTKPKGTAVNAPPSPQLLVLAQRIEALPEHQRHLIEEIVSQFDGRLSA